MDTLLTPSEAQLSKLMSLPSETPLAVLNLFEFNVLANYQPEDSEYGTDAAEMVFSAAADQVLIGPEEANWHMAAIMYFPSRRAFMQMMADPNFQQASRHRKAALKRHQMIHLNGEALR